MKKRTFPRKMLLPLGGLVFVALVLSYAIKDWIKAVVITPMIDAALRLYILVDNISQTVIWSFVLLLGGLFLLKKLLKGATGELLDWKSSKGDISMGYLQKIINLVDYPTPNRYNQIQLAKYLTELYFESLGYESTDYQKIQEKFESLRPCLDPGVANVFHFGLFESPYQENHTKLAILSENSTKFPSQNQFEQTIQLIEHQLFLTPTSSIDES